MQSNFYLLCNVQYFPAQKLDVVGKSCARNQFKNRAVLRKLPLSSQKYQQEVKLFQMTLPTDGHFKQSGGSKCPKLIKF